MKHHHILDSAAVGVFAVAALAKLAAAAPPPALVRPVVLPGTASAALPATRPAATQAAATQAAATQAASHNDLHYIFSRLDDPDPAVRDQAFVVCRMASAAGTDLLDHDLQQSGDKLSADSRKQLANIIQQQRAFRDLQRDDQKEFVDWRRRTTVEAYDESGTRSPDWDQPAREAIEIWFDGYRTEADRQRLHQDTDKAATAHCKDALFHFVHISYRNTIDNNQPAERTNWFHEAATILDKSYYPSSRKIFAWAAFLRAASYEAEYANDGQLTTHRDAVAHGIDQILALLPDASDEDGIFRADLFSAAYDAIAAATHIGVDRQAAFERFDKVLGAIYKHSAKLLALKGEVLIDYAWDARGGGWANTVTDQGWQLFGQRISAASDALQASWKINPQALRAAAAANMITVCMAQSAPDEVRQLWFRRALEANPDNVEACRKEMRAIDPRWSGGDGTALMHLARMFELSGNDEAGITLLVSSVQWALACSTVYSDGQAPSHDYFHRPEVWQSIDRVYSHYLAKYPADRSARDDYIACAAAAGQWDVVKAQLPMFFGYPNPNIYAGAREDFLKVWKLCADRYRRN